MKPETAKRTALEWLEYEFVKLESTVGVHSSMYHLIEKAKEMERWQIMNAYDIGWLDCKNSGGKYLNDQYYFETFNSNEK
jgi:hypothetical protein